MVPVCCSLFVCVAVMFAGCASRPGPARMPSSPTRHASTGAWSTAWAAQLWTGGHLNCSGAVVADGYVLSAAHCVEGLVATDLTVHVEATYPPRGQALKVTDIARAPDGDVALLKVPVGLSSHAMLSPNLAYVPRDGQGARFYGFGYTADEESPHSLKSGDVKVIGTNELGKNGPTIIIRGVTEAPYPGDSGGPLVINGHVVGVGSTTRDDDGPHSTAYYARLSAHCQWLIRVLYPDGSRGCSQNGHS